MRIAQSASSVVLPNPASATIRPSRPAAARSSQVLRRSRDRVSSRGGGQWILAGWIGERVHPEPARCPPTVASERRRPAPLRPDHAPRAASRSARCLGPRSRAPLRRWRETIRQGGGRRGHARHGDAAAHRRLIGGGAIGPSRARRRAHARRPHGRLGGRSVSGGGVAARGTPGRMARPARPGAERAATRAAGPGQPSYSNPILSWTWYSTTSPSSIRAVDFTTSTSGCCAPSSTPSRPPGGRHRSRTSGSSRPSRAR